ncbi:MAG: glutamate--tRNA ligase [Helicobacteraceae bacterium]|jgi:glutamyl-tRNA synthetase|nr:glutamate--tRNA ligase [Helicobacteraceae bacterium]
MIVTRFAPSPTGFLHIGGLRTALFSYLWARKNGGKFLLRIEDTDQARNSEAAVKAILEAFEWVKMDYDGAIEYQSKRFDIYAEYVNKLLDSGKAYRCYMSKEELDALREEQIKLGKRPRYDGRYRSLPPKEGVKPVVRIKSPTSGKVTIEDGVKGAVSFEWSETVDDFIIARSDGTPTYNFVVAVDDALMGVTDVIRGDDHLSNTPKQIVVYNALGFAVPKFFHVPMILSGEGKKLSKRDGATDVMEYKKMGYLPEALLNFLVRLGWSHGDQEIFSRQELLRLFDPRSINKSASAYNASKLLWINSEYIKQKNDQELIALLKEDFSLDVGGFKNAALLFNLCKEKARTLMDFASEARRFLLRPESYDEKDAAAVSADAIALCERFLEFARDKGEFHQAIGEFLEANDLKMPQLAKPMRVALFGAAQGPALAESLAILGVKEAQERVAALKNRVCRG